MHFTLALNITILAQISFFGSLNPQYGLLIHINIPLLVHSIILSLKIIVGHHSLAAFSSCSSNHINCLVNLHTRGKKTQSTLCRDTRVSMKIAVSWDATLCSPLDCTDISGEQVVSTNMAEDSKLQSHCCENLGLTDYQSVNSLVIFHHD